MKGAPRIVAAVTALAALMLAAAPARAATAVNPPGALAKTLRAIGLQTPPGARGDRAYRKGDYEEAVRQYGHAVEETDSVPALLDLNLGNALYRQKRLDEAADYYARALKRSGSDTGLAAAAHYNLGNALYRKAETTDSTQADAVMAGLREAIAQYKKAVRLGSTARDADLAKDARRNLEIADARLRKLQEERKQNPPPQKPNDPTPPPDPSARAKEALARALQLAQERRYAEAAGVLDEILKTDKTAASYSAHRKRLDDVMKIQRGETPADPAPRDPRAIPWMPGAPGGRGTP